MSVLLSAGALIVVLGVLIFIHEAGHFLAAKAAGIHVHRFSLGLGTPIKALSFTRGGTEYAVSWIPLGGYVKMATAEEEATSSALEGGAAAADVPRDAYFESQPVWVRMIVILAGVTMNALFAWAVFTGLVFFKGLAVNPELRVGHVSEEAVPKGAEALLDLQPGDSIVAVAGRPVATWDDVARGIQSASPDTVVIARAGKPPVVVRIHPDALQERAIAAAVVQPWLAAAIGQVDPNTAASRAGLEAGDTVVAIDGEPVTQWYDMVEIIRANPDHELTLKVARAGATITLAATPALVVDTTPEGAIERRGQLGIRSLIGVERRPVTLPQAVAIGGRQTVANGTLVVRSVRGLLTTRVSSRDLGGPILIGQLAGENARLGLDRFLAFMALISINLAVLNLLPIPVLDGGQFLFLVAEGVLRRPLSLKLRERLTAVGLVLILMLMGLAFWNDLSRLFRSFFG